MLSRWLVRGREERRNVWGATHSIYLFIYIFFCDFLLRLFALTTSNALQQRSTSCGTWPMPNVIKQVTSNWHTHTHTHTAHTLTLYTHTVHTLPCTHLLLVMNGKSVHIVPYLICDFWHHFYGPLLSLSSSPLPFIFLSLVHNHKMLRCPYDGRKR